MWTTRASFDPLVASLRGRRLGSDETTLLKPTHWDHGEDARLREDVRFQETPWGQWVLTEQFVANEHVVSSLRSSGRPGGELDAILAELSEVIGRPCVLCVKDPRIVVAGTAIRLAAGELGREPALVAAVTPLEEFRTHLPLYSLEAAAALPIGPGRLAWGPEAEVEARGWVEVHADGLKLNSRMFIARIVGDSMNDGKSGLVSGALAIFELEPSAGSPNGQIVLLRGAFRDPETGGYAVKRFMPGAAQEGGGWDRVCLESLNPDKKTFPTIVLRGVDGGDVTVVGRFVRVLSLEDYARRPKSEGQTKGRRDLTGPVGEGKVAQRLEDRLQKLFGTPDSVETSVSGASVAPNDAPTGNWSARLVCGAPEDGGLAVEVGPLHGLWRFVRQLSLRDGSHTKVGGMLGGNVRQHPEMFYVRPGAGPWHVTADGFEDEADVDLTKVRVDAPDVAKVTVFRVNADGLGVMVATDRLSRGSVYRLLVPPVLAAKNAGGPAARALGGGWQLCELNVARQDAVWLRGLGLKVGGKTPCLEWGEVSSPARWRRGPMGDLIAVFPAGETMKLKLSGLESDTVGEVRLFLRGPGTELVMDLPLNDGCGVEVLDAEIGGYVACVVHEDVAVSPVELVFEVVAELPPWPVASVVLRLGELTLPFQPGVTLTKRAPKETPLRDNLGEAFRIDGPPGWPVRIYGGSIATRFLGEVYLDADGCLTGNVLPARVHEMVARESIGDLVFDAGDFGSVVMPFDRETDLQELRAVLGKLVELREAWVRSRPGAWWELFGNWFQPVCRHLGYEAEWLDVAEADEAPGHASVAQLMVTERQGSNFKRKAQRLLVMVDLGNEGQTQAMLAWVDGLCDKHDVTHVVMTDGLRWAERRRRQQLSLRVHDLVAAVADEERCMDFLRDAAVNV